jgi:hypothetical protein
MRPNFNWKICRLSFTVLILLFIHSKGYSQVMDKIDFTYKVDSLKVGAITEYEVKITVNQQGRYYNYSLYEGIPWKDGLLKQVAENESNSVYTFKNLQSNKLYMIEVQYSDNVEVNTRKSFKIPAK